MMLPFNAVLCVFIPFMFALDTVAGRVDQKFMEQIREIISSHPSQCLSPLGKAWFFTMDGSCGRINCKPPYTLCTVSYIAKGSQDLHYQCTNVPASCLALVRRAHYAGNSKRRLDDASSTKFISGNDVAPVMAQPESQQAAETCEDDPSQRSAAPISSLGASILGPIYILPISGCNNGHEKCCDWASKGECSKNPVMMKTLCKQACGTCGCRAEEVMICQPAVNLISCKPPTKGPCRPKQPAAVTGAPEVVEPEQPSEAVETQPPEVHVPEETEPAPSEGVAVTEAPPEITGEPEAPTEEYRPPEAPPEETQPPEVVTEAPVPETTQVSETDVCEDGETVTEGQGIQETGEPAPAVTEAPPEVATEGAEEVTTGFPEEVFTPGEVPSEVPGGAPAEVETVAPVEVPTEVPGGAPAEVETVAPAEVPSEVPGGAPGEIATVPPAEVPTEPAGAECETEAPEVGTEHPETPAPGPIEETGAPEAPQPGPTEEMPVETPAPEPEGPAGPAEPAGPAGPEVEVTEEVRPETTPQPPGTVASRPLPEVTYGPPAFPTSTCPDSVVTCAFWANKGECEKNPFWMKPNCQKSCNSCGATVGTVNKPASKPGCENQHELCQFWKSIGECASNLNYMMSKCPLSCESCGRKPSLPVGPSTGIGYGG
ncbi:shTK domain protein [Trichuris suis]|nr:shTK domain protein [Trichuris suis]